MTFLTFLVTYLFVMFIGAVFFGFPLGKLAGRKELLSEMDKNYAEICERVHRGIKRQQQKQNKAAVDYDILEAEILN